MNRIMNSIKMGALCDALGEPLEFKTNNFDNVTYDDYEITDDTQMTLFVMEGLTQGNVKKALLEWYCTQSYGNDINNPICWFYKDKRMHKQMAPGCTCISSLEELYYNNEREENDSKGNGALIRSAPYGMLNCDSVEAYEKAYKDSLITHGHYYSAVSSGIFAYMINLILKENITIEEATKRGIKYLKEIENIDGEKYIKITNKEYPERNKVRITVFNTGENISKENLSRVWNRFFKADEARNREDGGSGIGLSIVRAIMNNYGNDFGVENKDNGVEFYFEADMKEIEKQA